MQATLTALSRQISSWLFLLLCLVPLRRPRPCVLFSPLGLLESRQLSYLPSSASVYTRAVSPVPEFNEEEDVGTNDAPSPLPFVGSVRLLWRSTFAPLDRNRWRLTVRRCLQGLGFGMRRLRRPRWFRPETQRLCNLGKLRVSGHSCLIPSTRSSRRPRPVTRPQRFAVSTERMTFREDIC